MNAPEKYKPWLFAGFLFFASIPSAHSATQTRASAFVYDGNSGLLVKEVIEPGDSNLCLVTEYLYDAYGNKVTATTRNCNGSAGGSPANSEAAAPVGDAVIASRASGSSYGAGSGGNGLPAYPAGQFPSTSSNALNQIETKTYDARFGAVTSLIGPNGLTAQWQYDNFGRKVLEVRADGTRTQWAYLYCQGVNGGLAPCPTVGGATGAFAMLRRKTGGEQCSPNSLSCPRTRGEGIFGLAEAPM